MQFLTAVLSLWQREMVRFLRQRSRVFGAFATPVLFWLFLGSGLGSSFNPPSAHGGAGLYLEYFFPGTILLVVLFTAIFSSLSLIEDRKEGFLLSVLVAPVSRQAIVLGKILGSATLATGQGALLLLLSPLLGIHLSLLRFLGLTAVIFLIALGLAALGFATAWRTESLQGYHSVMNVVLFPMWLLSGALFPREGALSWVRWLMTVNPLSYSQDALVGILRSDHAGSTAPLSVSLAVTAVFGCSMFLWSVLAARRGRIAGLA